jgi:hypothetical protein
MVKKIDSGISVKLKVLGIYQIAGGLIGIALTIWLITITEQSAMPSLLPMYLIAFVLYTYSIFCGTLLLMKKEAGLNHSLVNQYLQLVNLSVAGYGFTYISGVYVSAGFDLTNSSILKMNFGVSTWTLQFNIDTEVVLFNINFVALLLIIFIDKLKKQISEHKMLTEVSQMANV